ncbi:MAG TPA: right-handed parallel beta-helix repeat-containing protein [Pseudonocardia sp.]|jgi:hypothetical protein|nr:right-handed parallel beta-helix repeat-containing protein [Pseudonocardia sp.]
MAILIPSAGAFSAHPTTPVPPVASPRVVPVADDDGGDGGTDDGGDTPGNGGGSGTGTPGGDAGNNSGSNNSGGNNSGNSDTPGNSDTSDGGDSTSEPAAPSTGAEPSAGAEPSTGAEPSEAPPVPDKEALAAQRRAANAARRAQHASAASRSASSGSTRAGRPDRLIIVRSRNIDLVSHGQLTSRVARAAGAPLSWRSLARYLPPGWLTLNNDGTALLSAALMLTPGTVLDSGTDIRILRLAGGPLPGAAASIWLSHAQLRLHNIEITSVDAATQGPLADTAEGRPFLVAGAGATLTIADATLRNLGGALAPVPAAAPPPAGPAPARPLPARPSLVAPGRSGPQVGAPPTGSSLVAPGRSGPKVGAPPTAPPAAAPQVLVRPGVLFGAGSTGSVSRTELTGNTVGLQLDGSRAVALDDVTLDHSSTDGLVLHGDQGTVLRAVQSTANGRNGVLVSGAGTNRVITGISTVANAAFGIAVVRQVRPQITGVTGKSDQGGGLRLTGTIGAVVSNATFTGEQVGVLINGTNDKSQLTNVRVRGGHDGIVLTHAVTGASITASNVENPVGTGVKISGGDTQVRSLSVIGAAAAVRISPTAHGVNVVDSSISGGGDGFLIARGAQGVILTNPTIQGPSRNGVKTASANARIIGGRIIGGATGINARAATTVSGTAITNAGDGVRTSPGGGVAADHIDVLGGNVGVKVEPNTTITVTDSRIRSRDSLRGTVTLVGDNVVSPPPFNWIAALGVLFVLLALVLETTAAGRLRGYRRRAAAFASSGAGTATGVGAGSVVGTGAVSAGAVGPGSDAPTMAIPIAEPPTEAIPIAEPPTEAIPVLEPPTMAIPVIDPPTMAIPILPAPEAEPAAARDAGTKAPAETKTPATPEPKTEPKAGAKTEASASTADASTDAPAPEADAAVPAPASPESGTAAPADDPETVSEVESPARSGVEATTVAIPAVIGATEAVAAKPRTADKTPAAEPTPPATDSAPTADADAPAEAPPTAAEQPEQKAKPEPTAAEPEPPATPKPAAAEAAIPATPEPPADVERAADAEAEEPAQPVTEPATVEATSSPATQADAKHAEPAEQPEPAAQPEADAEVEADKPPKPVEEPPPVEQPKSAEQPASAGQSQPAKRSKPAPRPETAKEHLQAGYPIRRGNRRLRLRRPEATRDQQALTAVSDPPKQH